MKKWLISWLFSKEKDDIRRENARAKIEADEAERYRKSLSIVDLVREQLHGFNPHLLDTEDELLEIITDEESQEAFLNEVKKLADNTALPRIMEHLIRNQVLYSAKEAPTLDAINFGRASVNGITLIQEEIERLKTLFDERHAPKEQFDVHKAL